jgi:hypothetical protein
MESMFGLLTTNYEKMKGMTEIRKNLRSLRMVLHHTSMMLMTEPLQEEIE